MFTPTALDLGGLFRDPEMFDSARAWRKAGFVVDGEGLESDVMVASHPSAPGYLFKKYSKKVSLKDQLKNYRQRVAGAQKLRAFVAAQQLTRIVVPGKYLHELPPAFARKGVPAFVLIVERLPILDSGTSKRMYREMDDDVLRQLCTVLLEFRGLDSGVRNAPFTTAGQIAFVDTERWDQKRKEPLRRIREYLTADQRALAEALFKSR